MEWLILIGVLAVAFGGLGGWVATQKQRSALEGLVLGLLFGPLGVLVEALLPQRVEQPVNPRTGSGGGRTIDEPGFNLPVNSRTGSGGRRTIDELGFIAMIADRFRTVLEEHDPNWERLPYHRKRAVLKPFEMQLMRELGLSHTMFSDYASEARRSLFGTGKEQT
jgi:hypothetical protein